MISPLKRFLAAVAADLGHTTRDIQVLNLEMVRLFLKTGPFNGKSKLQAGGAQKLQYSGLPSHIFNCIFIMI